jgi:hypothetical protein
MDFAWITNDVGDITAVNVTSPITGGGSSGAVTIGVSAASTAATGVVQLSDSTSTTSSVLAATPTAVKAAFDKASTAATTSIAGIVQLSDSTSTTSSILASTPTATKSAYDLADAAIAKSTVTTAGDIIYRNATVPARLGIGTAGQVLTVNSGATAPEWAAAAAGGMTLLSTTTLSGTSTSVTVAANTYKNLVAYVYGATTASGNFNYNCRINSITASTYLNKNSSIVSAGTIINSGGDTTAIDFNQPGLSAVAGANNTNVFNITFWDCNSTKAKLVTVNGYFINQAAVSLLMTNEVSVRDATSAITNITVISNTALTAGTIEVYGVK